MTAARRETNWNRVEFGEFADNIAERVDPATAQTEVYVGLEHLDPGSLHLRRWGHPSDVTGQKLKFKKGDVIFGRRRAYQRKLAIAECDGICSAHAMVVRAKPSRMLPEFLPFFLQSDVFMDRAIEISVGSLSPTINWRTLKIQEFPLPPIKEQKRVAELLWAVDASIESFAVASTALARTHLAIVRDELNQPANTTVGEVVSLASGKAKTRANQFELSAEHRIPVYGGNGITGYTDRPLVSGPAIIIGRVGEYCGSVHFERGDCWVTDNAIYVQESQAGVLDEFLYYVLLHANLNSRKRLAGQPLINQQIISSTAFHLPPVDQQQSFMDKLLEIDQRQSIIESHLLNSKNMLSQIASQLVRGGSIRV